ncbi:conjugal transfer protein TrbL family protein [Bacillus sp. FJAT-28004]|uniref:conjugal transfer protein TrbL family protein n=1 Tax=Bacillus sp. FJAT-28004 TaxID=1679165 RepID=UPI0006B646E4|nr:conjugal transfer protein TrbL family protein [Bacillus sp. FJAT-28004]
MFENMISGAMEAFFSGIAESAIKMLTDLLSGMSDMTTAVLNMAVVSNSILYAQALAGSILIMKFTYELWYNHILRANGDSDADVQGVMVRLVQAAAMIITVPWITTEVYKWGTAIATDIGKLEGKNISAGGDELKTMLIGALAASMGPLLIITAVVALFAIIVYLLILVQSFIRAAELAVVATVGSFMALGLTNPNSQAFQGWWRELLNISLAQAIQLFLVKCSFFAIAINPKPEYPLLNVMIFAGFIWVTYKSPTILKQYIYSTGVGKGAGQVAQQAGSMVMMRKLMTGGKA